uniref:uncharacterized protein LOC105351885 n=1 Tax=Fragaria vesca subsp. vesca TaxID=101020 RepID=UPI0005C92C9C|nr:PREDICTED: uncharacterized protein LOC105351885 [Fragaria vesca subsp. vesca]
MDNVEFKVNMKSATVEILRDALREHAIQGGCEYWNVKNDKQRLKTICVEDNYPFFLFAWNESTMKIKKYNPEHKCVRKFNNNMVWQKYLTRKFKDQIALNENWKTAKTMTSIIRSKVHKWTAYRAKRAALEEVEGSIREQYARLHDYGRELQRVDPTTTIDIKCEFPNGSSLPVFQRMYICLGALKKDNSSYVLAWAMVEAESKDSWIWFLELLAKDLNIKHEGRGWIFISDKQKGLIPALAHIVLRASVRFCVRHLWTNFTKLFPGMVLRDQMWACAKATTLPYFQKEMEIMKALDKDSYKWLTGIFACLSNLSILLLKRKADMKAQSAPKRARPGQAASTQQSSRPLQTGSAPSISRNVQGSNASTKKAGVTPKTSQRIRQSSTKGAGK